ncbi:MAG: hypothetical protein KAR54_03025 [Candidatus Pacebacteria bacterium]|nr:hypothetical protein [Candidatus Paceibacterota bacterium]
MKQIKNILNKFFWPIFYKIIKIIKSFSITERTIFYFFVIIFIISSLSLLNKINEKFIVETPVEGGSLIEGVVGYPRFINPILTSSNVDKDLSILIYSGLLKITPNGEIIKDLAESYSISEDGFVYNFKLKDNLYFHDGTPLTTEDIEFTINATQDNIIKSSKRANWDGVEIKRLNDKEIQFILTQPYSPFLENLSLGILPKHIWENISPEQFAFSQFNIEAIGSGPYKIDKIKRDSSSILESYYFKAFEDYALPRAYISKLIIKFYLNESNLLDAYSKGEIESINSITPDKLNLLKMNKDSEILSTPLPRIFGVFFNQNENSVFTHKEVRIALNRAVNKKQIINEVLDSYGVTIASPVPYKSTYYVDNEDEENMGMDSAKSILEENGWKLNEEGVLEKTYKKSSIPLSFSISTANTPELKSVAELLKGKWEELGAEVHLKIFEIGDLNQNVIRPRQYDSILFGEVIGHNMDLFAFWHSSQRNDPGLNIAMYANITTDNLLEEIRITTNIEDKKRKFEEFQKEIYDDVPAIFLYSPDFIYVTSSKIKNNLINQITVPSDRFLDVSNWYIKTDKIWRLFI